MAGGIRVKGHVSGGHFVKAHNRMKPTRFVSGSTVTLSLGTSSLSRTGNTVVSLRGSRSRTYMPGAASLNRFNRLAARTRKAPPQKPTRSHLWTGGIH